MRIDASSTSAVIQPKAPMNPWVMGENRNWPRERAAVAEPQNHRPLFRFHHPGHGRHGNGERGERDADSRQNPAREMEQHGRVRDGHAVHRQGVHDGTGNDDPDGSEAVCQCPGERQAEAPEEVLQRHGKAVDFPVPVHGHGHGLEKQPEPGTDAEADQGDQAPGGNDKEGSPPAAAGRIHYRLPGIARNPFSDASTGPRASRQRPTCLPSDPRWRTGRGTGDVRTAVLPPTRTRKSG